jgi:hypothetical protein
MNVPYARLLIYKPRKIGNRNDVVVTEVETDSVPLSNSVVGLCGNA